MHLTRERSVCGEVWWDGVGCEGWDGMGRRKSGNWLVKGCQHGTLWHAANAVDKDQRLRAPGSMSNGCKLSEANSVQRGCELMGRTGPPFGLGAMCSLGGAGLSDGVNKRLCLMNLVNNNITLPLRATSQHGLTNARHAATAWAAASYPFACQRRFFTEPLTCAVDCRCEESEPERPRWENNHTHRKDGRRRPGTRGGRYRRCAWCHDWCGKVYRQRARETWSLCGCRTQQAVRLAREERR